MATVGLAMLAGCGGGGGGAPAASTTPAVLASITPSAAATNVDPDTFIGVVVSATGKLDAASLTATNVTVKAGTTTYSGGATPSSDGKSFTFATTQTAITGTTAFRPAQKVEYGKTYTVTVNAKDANGNVFVVNSTFSTKPLATCVGTAMPNSKNICMPSPGAGYTWNNIVKAWVADIGTLVTGANTLPAACAGVGDACWLDMIANGTIKLVASGAIATGLNTRPVIFGFFINTSAPFVGAYNVMPLYADTQAEAAVLNQSPGNGSINSTITEIKGSTLGAKQFVPSQGCFERSWAGSGFGNTLIACPI